jgi:hypothetical protein
MTLNEKNLDLCFGWMFSSSGQRGTMVRETEDGDYEVALYYCYSGDDVWHFDDSENYAYYDSLQELIKSECLPVSNWVPGNSVNLA